MEAVCLVRLILKELINIFLLVYQKIVKWRPLNDDMRWVPCVVATSCEPGSSLSNNSNRFIGVIYWLHYVKELKRLYLLS